MFYLIGQSNNSSKKKNKKHENIDVFDTFLIFCTLHFYEKCKMNEKRNRKETSHASQFLLVKMYEIDWKISKTNFHEIFPETL